MSTRLIEPCCADRQVPTAIREKTAALTATSGDVTMHHWMRAASYMAGPQWELTVQTAELTIAHLRYIREWMQRGWASHVSLTIAQDQRELILSELSGLCERVSIAIDGDMKDECIAFSGERGNVVIAGRVIAETQPGLSLYAISHTKPGDPDEVYQAICSRHKLRKVDAAFPLSRGNTKGSDQTTPAPPIQEGKAPKRVRRKKGTS